MEPRRSRLAPSLKRWARTAGSAQRRTVVVRFGPATPAGDVTERLEAWGADVRQRGAATVSCRVTPETLEHLAAQSWVVAVEEPRRLFPASPADVPPASG